MFLYALILTISSSIDSLGIGITYGIRNTTISFIAKIILFAIAFIVSVISILIGGTLKDIFSTNIIEYIGSFILILMGIFIFFQSIKNKNVSDKKISKSIDKKLKEQQKIYSFFIKCLGITVQILKNPTSSDFDKSNTIDAKEAVFLGLALSLDSFGIGMSFGMIENFTFYFPLFISLFQLFFLNFGNFLGKKLCNFSKIPENIWSIISGILLVIIGFAKLFF